MSVCDCVYVSYCNAIVIMSLIIILLNVNIFLKITSFNYLINNNIIIIFLFDGNRTSFNYLMKTKLFISKMISVYKSRRWYTLYMYIVLYCHCHQSLLTSQMNLFIWYQVFTFYTVKMNTDFEKI